MNFFAVFLFVPETRYTRTTTASETDSSTASPSSEEDIGAAKIASAGVKPIRRTSDDAIPQQPKKSFTQELKLWSGTPATNLFKMFIRYARIIAMLVEFVADVFQALPDDHISSCHLLFSLLFDLSRDCGSSEYLEFIRSTSAALQLGAANQWPNQHSRIPRQSFWRLGRRYVGLKEEMLVANQEPQAIWSISGVDGELRKTMESTHYPVFRHSGWLRPIWLWCPELYVMGLTVLWVWNDIRCIDSCKFTSIQSKPDIILNSTDTNYKHGLRQ